MTRYCIADIIIVIRPDGVLIAGGRRLACKALGWTEIRVHVVGLDKIERGEHDCLRPRPRLRRRQRHRACEQRVVGITGMVPHASVHPRGLRSMIPSALGQEKNQWNGL
jgi:hypothetical protein